MPQAPHPMPSIRKPQPSLVTKKPPAQQRATETYERILEVTAQTLADVGIERLSTNLVCERAGLSPRRSIAISPTNTRYCLNWGSV
jgi:hypothetical protein